MSLSWSVRVAVFQRLSADAGVAAHVANRIYDNPPPGSVLPYLAFGPTSAVTDDADCISGLAMTVQIDCWSEAQDGDREALLMTDAVRRALHGWTGSIDPGAIVGCDVDLVRVFRDQDGISTHGVVQATILLEDAP